MSEKKIGRYRWGIKLIDPLQFVTANADVVKVTDNGDLILADSEDNPVLIYAQGTWSQIAAISTMSGLPIAVDHVRDMDDDDD